ncbi:helix-turn-helix domain-containing protein [Enterococcus sp. DIV0187]|uniref:helix-turn-helix domain-containing protein n=1 Tax=Enterococcus sp. DIV0187 TaxID=2774644 RepID=UPI003F276FC8
MFGLDYQTLLKRDIIERLDSVDYPISIEELKEQLGYSNSVTILKMLKELSQLVTDVYANSEYSIELITVKRGVFQLKRQGSNLQDIFHAIFTRDFAYKLLSSLIEKRTLSSIEICNEWGLSQSTLQRRVRLINKKIKAYSVYVSCAEKIQFKSNELNIRIFSYVFLWSTNRQISKVSWIENKSKYLDLSKSVMSYLGMLFDPFKIEILAFWVFIYSNAILKKKELSLNYEQISILKDFSIPKRPIEFNSWSGIEWEMFVLTLYNSDIYDFDLSIVEMPHSSVLKSINGYSSTFLDCFVMQFSSLNSKKQKEFNLLFTKSALSSYFSEYSIDYTGNTAHVVNFAEFSKDYPNYWTRFKRAWACFIDKKRESKHLITYESVALSLCLSIFPLNKFSLHPLELQMFISSDISISYERYLEEMIKEKFQNKYKIKFTKNFLEAQIVVTTIANEQTSLPINQQLVIISPRMKKDDYLLLEKSLSSVTKMLTDTIRCRKMGK